VLWSQGAVFAGGLHGIVGAGTVTDTAQNFDREFQNTQMVDEADIFISHTWTADSWLKHAAICLHLNFKPALGIAISAWISVIGYIAITGLTSWGGCHFLVVAGVYVPTLLFFLVVFYGHRLSSLLHEQPTVWLDK
ncbi:unnamed protein product, partial [Symbiodinium microadriaticum]